MTGWFDLANAIIKQAADDYRAAVLLLKIDPTDKVSQDRLREIEKFFRSNWVKVLTAMDPDYILERLRREIRK